MLIEWEQSITEYSWKQGSPVTFYYVPPLQCSYENRACQCFEFKCSVFPSDCVRSRSNLSASSTKSYNNMHTLRFFFLPSPHPTLSFFLSQFSCSNRSKGYLSLGPATVDKAYKAWCSHIFLKGLKSRRCGYAESVNGIYWLSQNTWLQNIHYKKKIVGFVFHLFPLSLLFP